MPLSVKLRQQLESVLGVLEEQSASGTRLLDDAARLWSRLRRLAAAVADSNLVAAHQPDDAMELACYALQLPLRSSHTLPGGRLGRINLRERAEQAAELLLSVADQEADEALLDRATRLLNELPQRDTTIDDARLLADALNLEDFGLTGLLNQAIQLARQGEGIAQLREGCEKREQYGYWDARLKEFHFEPARQIARRRLEDHRAACRLLLNELAEDQPPP
jgi:hypothetical protein